jgi:hypothetical protein
VKSFCNRDWGDLMDWPNLDLLQAVRLCAIIAAIGIVYNAVELSLHRQEILEKFYNWRIVRSRYYILIGRPALGWLFDISLTGNQFIYAVAMQAVAAVLFPIAVSFNLWIAAMLAGYVLGVHLLIHIRMLVGMDGSDQMQTVIWASLFMYCLPLNETARTTAALFIAAQLVLSYLVSGLAKLGSPVWRGGFAIAQITRTATYCTADLAKVLARPAISASLCWATILFEVGSPFLLLGGRAGAVALIVMGTGFHVGIALAMGLTTFIFAFLATFPLVYYFAGGV